MFRHCQNILSFSYKGTLKFVLFCMESCNITFKIVKHQSIFVKIKYFHQLQMMLGGVCFFFF